MTPENEAPRGRPSAREQRALRSQLARTRKRLDLSFKAVAAEAGYYSDSMICKVENGEARMSRRGFDSLRRWLASKAPPPAPTENGRAA